MLTKKLTKNSAFALSGVDNRVKQLDHKALQVDKTLEFMVWDTERQKIINQALPEVKERINLRPYESIGWRRILFLSYESTGLSEELSTLVNHLHQIEGWNTQYQLRLIRYCVPYAYQTNPDRVVDVPQACRRMADKFKEMKDQELIARKIGLSKQELTQLYQSMESRSE